MLRAVCGGVQCPARSGSPGDLRAACGVRGGGRPGRGRLSDPRDILRYCWFAALYVDMAGAEDEVGYVVEGEGDWGEPVGFAVKGDRVTYVGPDYLEAMENPY